MHGPYTAGEDEADSQIKNIALQTYLLTSSQTELAII